MANSLFETCLHYGSCNLGLDIILFWWIQLSQFPTGMSQRKLAIVSTTGNLLSALGCWLSLRQPIWQFAYFHILATSLAQNLLIKSWKYSELCSIKGFLLIVMAANVWWNDDFLGNTKKIMSFYEVLLSLVTCKSYVWSVLWLSWEESTLFSSHSLPNMEPNFLLTQHNVLCVRKSAPILQHCQPLVMCSVTLVSTNT